MTIATSDALFFGAGDCVAQFGTLSLKTSPGEDNPEIHTRADVAEFTDPAGVLRLAAANIPRIEWLGTAVPTLLVDYPDTIYFPWPWVRGGVALYLDFYHSEPMATGGALLHVGSATETATPRITLKSSGTYFQGVHDDGSTSSTATLGAAPTLGDRVELLVTVDPDDGHLSIYQSIVEAAETSATDATTVALSGAYAAARLYVGSSGATRHLLSSIRSIKCVRFPSGQAEPTILEMRGLFADAPARVATRTPIASVYPTEAGGRITGFVEADNSNRFTVSGGRITGSDTSGDVGSTLHGRLRRTT